MRINALPKPPEFLLHTGDLTHLTEPEQFDTLARLLKECRTKGIAERNGPAGLSDRR